MSHNLDTKQAKHKPSYGRVRANLQRTGEAGWFGQWHQSPGIFSRFSGQPRPLLPVPEMGFQEGNPPHHHLGP